MAATAVKMGDLLVAAELCRVVEEELAPAAQVDPQAFWAATSAIITEFMPRNKVRLGGRPSSYRERKGKVAHVAVALT